MLPLALSALVSALLSASAPTPADAVSAALAAAGSRAEVVSVRAAAGGCAAESFEAIGPVEASGQVPLRLAGRDARGAPCSGAAWASVRVFAPALVLARALREGDALEGAAVLSERELRAGRPAVLALPRGATAARALRAGEALDPGDLRTGPRPGEEVTVVVRLGSVQVERPGRAVPCPRAPAAGPALSRGCALLPGGRRVDGRWQEGRVVVEGT